MGDVLDEAYGIVQCKECPWYKSCVIPMKFTAEDIRRQLESSAPGMGTSGQAALSALSTPSRRRATSSETSHLREETRPP